MIPTETSGRGWSGPTVTATDGRTVDVSDDREYESFVGIAAVDVKVDGVIADDRARFVDVDTGNRVPVVPGFRTMSLTSELVPAADLSAGTEPEKLPAEFQP